MTLIQLRGGRADPEIRSFIANKFYHMTGLHRSVGILKIAVNQASVGREFKFISELEGLSAGRRWQGFLQEGFPFYDEGIRFDRQEALGIIPSGSY